jgi:DNA modification methylase
MNLVTKTRASDLLIVNPKMYAEARALDRRLFPYYAGYSRSFATQLLASTRLNRRALVLDPWNGSGTTIHAACALGQRALGVDLNPAMVVVAKAGLVAPSDAPSLVPLAESIAEQADCQRSDEPKDDPLEQWLSPTAAAQVRHLEAAINRMLVRHDAYQPLNTVASLNGVAPLAAFFYVALFRSVRRQLAAFIPTNPTWIKRPRSLRKRLRPTESKVRVAFLKEVTELASTLARSDPHDIQEPRCYVRQGTSEHLALSSESVDFVLTSPPYCTRIDYAMATAIELAILRNSHLSFVKLRRSLMGTSTVPLLTSVPSKEWGPTCTAFLDEVRAHKSKASTGYYYKSHVQYFTSLFSSIKEIARVLKPRAYSVLVVQDSYYKDIHNDVPVIVTEMAATAGLVSKRRDDFAVRHSMVQLNTRARRHLQQRSTQESVVCLAKS